MIGLGISIMGKETKDLEGSFYLELLSCFNSAEASLWAIVGDIYGILAARIEERKWF